MEETVFTVHSTGTFELISEYFISNVVRQCSILQSANLHKTCGVDALHWCDEEEICVGDICHIGDICGLGKGSGIAFMEPDPNPVHSICLCYTHILQNGKTLKDRFQDAVPSSEFHVPLLMLMLIILCLKMKQQK